MKMRFNICSLYLLIILLCSFNGTLYEGGGIIAQGLQYLLILLSIFYVLYANTKYKLPLYFKALNILLVMFTIYGMLLVIGGEHFYIKATNLDVSNTTYLKNVYLSLLPVYPFYVFANQGLLKENTIKFWFVVFFTLAVRSYFVSRGAIDIDGYYTLNVGYTFVSLLPTLVIFNKKQAIQYLGLVVCIYFTVVSLKRGAILIGVICSIWFLYVNIKKAQKRSKWLIVGLSVIIVLAGVYLYYYLLETSAAFRYRLSMTEEGYTSGRDELFHVFYNHFINDDNMFRFLFGYGANATLKIGNNYAHNDWLELAIDQGLIGMLLYLAYWICLFLTWQKTKHNKQAFMAIGLYFIIYFTSTFFSMSFSCVSRCAAMTLGYFLALSNIQMNNNESLKKLEIQKK